ncbi:hypothetical protein JXA85_00945 [Candidatus Woesearchaeota archaeon]|nr:hypothetical protein [Candidatus Woesearchaeota archaeon]
MDKKVLGEQQIFREFSRWLKLNHDISIGDIRTAIAEKERSFFIPVSIITSELGILESVVKYLREIKGLKFSEIGLLLKRSPIALSSTYRSSKRKFPTGFAEYFLAQSDYDIPVDVFQDRVLAPLESVVVYLKDKKVLRFARIAELLKRDQRTIWTVYKRAKIKGK